MRPLTCQLKFSFLGAIFCIAACQYTHAQSVMKFKFGEIRFNNDVNAIVDSMAKATGGSPFLAIAHFNQPITEADRFQLTSSGFKIKERIDADNYVVLTEPLVARNRSTSLPSFGLTAVDCNWKIGGSVSNEYKNTSGIKELMIEVYNDITEAEVRENVIALGGVIDYSSTQKFGLYKIKIDASRLKSLLAWTGLKTLNRQASPEVCDNQSVPNARANIAQSYSPFGLYGLTGKGIVVGVGDNVAGIYHIDTKGKVINFNPAARTNHGQHINGIIGGTSIVDPLSASMAPGVSLIDHYYDNVLPITRDMRRDFNMSITNNSYGLILSDCNYSGVYDAYSRMLDSICLANTDVLHVFAAGNDGQMQCGSFPAGYGMIAGGYQPCKNVLTVGSIATDNIDAPTSSKGPVDDGRLKPEICAVGYSVYACIPIDTYKWAGGTSMASPQVAGAAALLSERYKTTFGVLPQSDLLKTVLMNGATDIGRPGPDFVFGYGMLDLHQSLRILDSNRYFTDTITTGQLFSKTINVPANTAQLKVMLYWHDAAGGSLSSKQLINDLDLSVTDPSRLTHLPLCLDPAPGSVTTSATEHSDHTNNVEQVVINTPTAGGYNLLVSGTSVPSGNRRFVLCYDFIPKGVQLTYPLGGETVSNSDSFRVYWDADNNGNTFKVEFSSNGGATWQTMADSIASQQRYFGFVPTGINTPYGKIRLTRNGSGEVLLSNNFIINEATTLEVDSKKCPGYCTIHFKKVPNATSYIMLKAQSGTMVEVGSVTDTTCTFSGLPLNDYSYLAVKPVIQGWRGYRSVAVKYLANQGDCNLFPAAFDLMAESCVNCSNGRLNTSSELSSTKNIGIKIRDLYNQPCALFTVYYSYNRGRWDSMRLNVTIPAKDTLVVFLPAYNFSNVGTYHLDVAVKDRSAIDANPLNDSLHLDISQLPNDTLTLPYAEDFEAMPVLTVNRDGVGILPDTRWDFSSQDTMGRLRTLVFDGAELEGQRAISMDEKMNVSRGSQNRFTGTFNLSGKDTSNNEIRLDFDYLFHGTPTKDTGNYVYFRANDSQDWQILGGYNLNAYPGYVLKSKSLSLTDAARATLSNFSSSTQIAFGQNDTSVIANRSQGNGMSIDNVRIYAVQNDAVLQSIVSPIPSACGLTGTQRVKVQVANGVNHRIYNIQLFYTYDSGTVFTGFIDSLEPKATVEYTFQDRITITQGKEHSLNVWLNAPGDSYTANDSILQFRFRNNKVISSYPYVENFEADSGGFYADGLKSSWQYGTPAATKIKKAASGTHAWKTNLTGNYNNLETSYLYSPCYDLTTSTKPMLSFSTALDIENCGTSLCDRAFVEYSFDGVNWQKLGHAGLGTNWYDSTFDMWTTNGFTRWHVASSPFPSIAGYSYIRFRFGLESDPGANYEGIAIDDVHVFERSNPIAEPKYPLVTSNVVGSNRPVYYDSLLLAEFVTANHTIPMVVTGLYPHDTVNNMGRTQYSFPRSYSVITQGDTADSYSIRLYLTEKDFLKTMNTTCPSCTPLIDAYSLGVSQYTLGDTECNGTMNDDKSGIWKFTPPSQVKWVPQDIGYYAEFPARGTTEFWFNNGGPLGSFPVGIDYVAINGSKNGIDAKVNWSSLIDTTLTKYFLQKSLNDTNYTTISNSTPVGDVNKVYSYDDVNAFANRHYNYYRVSCVLKNNMGVFNSPSIRIDETDSASVNITMNLTSDQRNVINVSWHSFADGVVNKYIVYRSVGDGAYQKIATVSSQRLYGADYSILDTISRSGFGSLAVHYWLAPVSDAGDTIFATRQSTVLPDVDNQPLIYPNPASGGTFNVSWFATVGTTMDLSISDISGRTLTGKTLTATRFANNAIISAPAQTGVYLVKMQMGDNITVARLVIE